jgi:hypothetical protein
MEVGEESTGKPQRPRGGKFTAAEKAASQLQGVQDVGQDIGILVFQIFRHKNDHMLGNKN